MISINDEQRDAVDCDEDVVITACPGSGKTRVLIARVIRALEESSSKKRMVLAMTYTHRAADEIKNRLSSFGINTNRLWAGTIHSFAIEWILRPFAPYLDETRYGFTVADEYYSDKLIREVKNRFDLGRYEEIDTRYDREGNFAHLGTNLEAAFNDYKGSLRVSKMLDFDDVLYYAFQLLHCNQEIAHTLAQRIELMCVDEVQDIQDLQYGILSEVHKARVLPVRLFFVGDENQSIYDTLGALAKTPSEIAQEFHLTNICHKELNGNYRSTQRIIDYCRHLRSTVSKINSRSLSAKEEGLITFSDQDFGKDELSENVSSLIRSALDRGTPAHEICVLAPRWNHVRKLGRQLVAKMPDVSFDAPGLSPLHSARDNIWFYVSRLFLTVPSPNRTCVRMNWADEVIRSMVEFSEETMSLDYRSSRSFLRLINSIHSPETDGLSYLRDVLNKLCEKLEISMELYAALSSAYEAFFSRASQRITEFNEGGGIDVEGLRCFFNHPSGVVVNTCHGVKGEEFDTVIAFGLLRGYVPHWNTIINESDIVANERESKLLYVVCSRAKRYLHLIAESGHMTQKRDPYETSRLLSWMQYDYDITRIA